MKGKNHFVEFKNQNIKKQDQKSLPRDHIISERMDEVMKQKFRILVQMYKGNAFENGYNPALAFRVIWLFLYCELSPEQFNLVEQAGRYFNHQLHNQNLEDIQKCMDLILTKNLSMRVPDKIYKFWKIKVLRSLKKYYAVNHLKKQKKKTSLVMRQLCKQQLKQQSVKHDAQIYQAIMEILIQEEKLIMNSKKAQNKLFEAIENANNIIRILEKAERALIPKYQEQLMLMYWEISKLHNSLHYITYAKKYAEATLNIAERINDKKLAHAANNFLQNLASN